MSPLLKKLLLTALGGFVLTVLAFVLMAIGQSGRVATIEGNAVSVVAAIVFIVGADQIRRRIWT